MPTVFFLSKLRPEADAKEYERWIREYDYPTSKKLRSIISYHAYKLTKSMEGERPYDYIEHIEITNIDRYKNDLTLPEARELLRQWSKFIGESKAVFGEVIG